MFIEDVLEWMKWLLLACLAGVAAFSAISIMMAVVGFIITVGAPLLFIGGGLFFLLTVLGIGRE